jgi:hypothetical protein
LGGHCHCYDALLNGTCCLRVPAEVLVEDGEHLGIAGIAAQCQ